MMRAGSKGKGERSAASLKQVTFEGDDSASKPELVRDETFGGSKL